MGRLLQLAGKLQQKAWAEFLHARFHSRLHIAAGYMDAVSSKIIERDIRAVGEYIGTIKRLIAR